MRRWKACSLALAWILLSVAATPARADGALDLDGLRGRVVYLDFWASWCVPCRHSFPWMEAMNNAYGQRGLTIIAINLDSDRVEADRFLQKYRPGFDVRFDPRGELARRFGVAGMPSSVVIDRHGKVRYTHIGFRNDDQAEYERQLKGLVAES